jgi:molecular chaperone DnaK
MPQVEVTFDIDANGIVNVSAKDKATGKEQQIRIQASGGLSESEIKNMVKDAEAHRAEDQKRRELVETKNQAEALAHSTERNLTELGDKAPAEVKSRVEADIAALRAVLPGEDKDAIKAKTEALMQSSMKLGEAMYQQTGAGAAGGPEGGPDAGPTPPGDEGVVDAEFEEVDDDKKKSSGG